jgi:hypothetical protein
MFQPCLTDKKSLRGVRKRAELLNPMRYASPMFAPVSSDPYGQSLGQLGDLDAIGEPLSGILQQISIGF